jgi:hypothetical protein
MEHVHAPEAPDHIGAFKGHDADCAAVLLFGLLLLQIEVTDRQIVDFLPSEASDPFVRTFNL